MSDDRKTGSLPRLASHEWRSWLLIGAMFIGPPLGGTYYVGGKFESSQGAVEANTRAINDLKIAMEGNKVTQTKLNAIEAAIEKHGDRLDAISASLNNHKAVREHDGASLRLDNLERRVGSLEKIR